MNDSINKIDSVAADTLSANNIAVVDTVAADSTEYAALEQLVSSDMDAVATVGFWKNLFSMDMLKDITILSIKVTVTYLILWLVVRIVKRVFNNIIKKKSDKNKDKTNIIFLRNFVIYALYLLGGLSILNQIPGLQALTTTLLTGAGILAAAVGFGSQQAISNIVSGIFMVFFKPFRVGDYIDLGGEYKGTVMDISLRHTTIQNAENRMIIVPNSVLNNQSLINSTITNTHTCAFLEVGIGYSCEIEHAITILREEVMKHPLLIDVRTPEDKAKEVPQVKIKVISWDDSSVTLRAWAWAENTTNAFDMKCDLLKSVKDRFDREGIEIPYPYRTVILQKEEVNKAIL